MNNKKSSSCPKAGIKIHETYPNNSINNNVNDNINNNLNNSQYASFKYSSNNNITLLNAENSNFDFNIDNYSLNGLYKLFNIDPNNGLNNNTIKSAKAFTLKTHPDKSKLDPKYFIFYSKAFNKLNEIYQYQNKSTKTFSHDNNYENEFSKFYNDDNKNILDKFIETNKKMSESSNFNQWFNEQFEKYDLEHKKNDGYGEWLKSNDNMHEFNGKVTSENLNEQFNKHKKDMLALSVYKSPFDDYESDDYSANLNSGNLGSDLKSVYSQTVIPVSEDDFDKINKYKNINEYKNMRETQDIKPLDEKESEKLLYNKRLKDEETSAAKAYEYAVQLEQSKKQNDGFWSSLKFLTYFS
jgi:hypothetical protein